MSVDQVVESAWVKLFSRFVMPAVVSLLTVVGGYEISAFKDASKGIEAAVTVMSKEIHEIKTSLAERDGEIKVIRQMLFQLQKEEDDHEGRVRILEKGK